MQSSSDGERQTVLIPTVIAEGTRQAVIPPSVKDALKQIDHFLAEDVRTARRYLSSLKIYDSIEPLQFGVLNKDTRQEDIPNLFAPVREGKTWEFYQNRDAPALLIRVHLQRGMPIRMEFRLYH